MEKYPRGRRGSPAKGVVRESVARVQIPLSPPKATEFEHRKKCSNSNFIAPPQRNCTNKRQSEFVLFLLYERFVLVCACLLKILLKSPIPAAWQSQKRDEQGNLSKISESLLYMLE